MPNLGWELATGEWFRYAPPHEGMKTMVQRYITFYFCDRIVVEPLIWSFVSRIAGGDFCLFCVDRSLAMPPRNRAAVVVLGDIGRSPRMQYHALSLARQGFLEVDIVAYGGSDPHTSLLENKSIHIHKVPQGPTVPQTFPKILRPLILICKPIVQFLMLLWYLCIMIPAPDVFIVQNPPSVPTLVVVKWASWLRHSAFIVDWHNFGYSLLAMSLGRSSHFLAVYRWVEKHFGKMAHGSLCVTRAMQHELAQNWGINLIIVL